MFGCLLILNARIAAQCAFSGKHFVTVDTQSLLALLGLDESDGAFAILAQSIGGPSADLPDSNIRPVEEPGLYGNLTPQEFVAGKSEYEKMLSGYSARGQQAQEHDKGKEIDR